MKKVKKILCLCLATCMLSIGTGVTAFAEESKEMVFGDDYVPQSLVNYAPDLSTNSENVRLYNSDNLKTTQSGSEVNDIIVSKKEITIESNGYSEYIDIFGKLEDGTLKNITNEVNYKIDNENIAEWINGRILAKGKGSTKITFEYNNLKEDIFVTVQEYVDLYKLLRCQSIDFNTIEVDNQIKSTAESSRSLYLEYHWTPDKAMTNAYNMIDVTWIPRYDIHGYSGSFVFEAGDTYRGVPYTQWDNQVNDTGFRYAWQYKSDFYDPAWRDNNPNWECPRYGNDCAGFVSFSLGLRGGVRGVWNTTEIMTSINSGLLTKISDYQSLQPADGLARYGHTLLVARNIPGEQKIVCSEQTGNYCTVTVHTYSELQNQGMIGFTRF